MQGHTRRVALLLLLILAFFIMFVYVMQRDGVIAGASKTPNTDDPTVIA